MGSEWLLLLRTASKDVITTDQDTLLGFEINIVIGALAFALGLVFAPELNTFSQLLARLRRKRNGQ